MMNGRLSMGELPGLKSVPKAIGILYLRSRSIGGMVSVRR